MSILLAFLAGGFICFLAQLLIDLTKLTPARILVMLVCFGVFLYALGVFEPMKKIFGCGVSLPLIGFGANIAKGAKEAVLNEGLRGIISGPLSSCGGGICFALICGFIASLFSKGKAKRM